MAESSFKLSPRAHSTQIRLLELESRAAQITNWDDASEFIESELKSAIDTCGIGYLDDNRDSQKAEALCHLLYGELIFAFFRNDEESRFQLAISYIEMSLQYFPSYEGYTFLSKVYNTMGNTLKSYDAFEKAKKLDLNPGSYHSQQLQQEYNTDFETANREIDAFRPFSIGCLGIAVAATIGSFFGIALSPWFILVFLASIPMLIFAVVQFFKNLLAKKE
jgi:tetratricopeptide (TPR) repeat protein